MGKLAKILLIIIPVIFLINFLTLANNNMTRSPFLHKIGGVIAFISFLSFALLVIYFILRRIAGLFHPKEKKTEPPKENNRPFNLIWFILFGFFVAPNIYYLNIIISDYLNLPYVFAAVGFFVCLLLIAPRRNNFFTLILLLIISMVTNLAMVRFYDLTWCFYPDLHTMDINNQIAEKWLAASSWGISFLTVTACIYVFLSSSARLFFKKTQAQKCFLIALFLTGIISYLLFYLLPISFTFPRAEIRKKMEPTMKLEILDRPDPVNAKHITTIQSASPFFIYAGNLQKGKRYGVQILDPEEKARKKTGIFFYCQSSNCQLNFGGWNGFSERFRPGVYTILIMAQEGNEMTIAAMTKIEITELIIKPLDKTVDYPCKMWLTLGESSKKLMRIDAGDQEMTNIRVYAQCPKGKTYDVQITVGTISNETQYFQSMSDPTGEPFRIISLGGNVAHGPVRLIINNQIMSEAIINRVFK